jgi:hypothetical protein
VGGLAEVGTADSNRGPSSSVRRSAGSIIVANSVKDGRGQSLDRCFFEEVNFIDERGEDGFDGENGLPTDGCVVDSIFRRKERDCSVKQITDEPTMFRIKRIIPLIIQDQG